MPVCLRGVRGTCGLVVEHLDEFDDVFVRGQQLQCLNLLQFLDLLYRLVLLFHAFDCHELVVFYRLSHEHLRKGALAFLRLQPVLIHPVETFKYNYIKKPTPSPFKNKTCNCLNPLAKPLNPFFSPNSPLESVYEGTAMDALGVTFTLVGTFTAKSVFCVIVDDR